MIGELVDRKGHEQKGWGYSNTSMGLCSYANPDRYAQEIRLWVGRMAMEMEVDAGIYINGSSKKLLAHIVWSGKESGAGKEEKEYKAKNRLLDKNRQERS